MSPSAPAFRAKLLGTLLCTLTALACGPAPESDAPEQAPLAESRTPVVYGNDDRQDVYAHPSATLQERARKSTVALMFPESIDASNPNNITFTEGTLNDWENLCSDQRFRDDPAPAFCSGTLIDDDLVLTAGHCIEDVADCADTRFVFKFYRTANGMMETITSADIFSCKSIVARKSEGENDQYRYVDFTIVKLDRSAAPRFSPAPVRPGNAPLAVGANVAVIGSGSGIPFKIDSGGAVRENNAAFMDNFIATTDTFSGNSGSGVYETVNNTVAGILVRGEEDYVPRDGANCNEVNVCTETGCSGEGIIYVNQAITEFCARNINLRLCNTTPPPPTKYAFTASNTASATRNTVNGTVTLAAGQQLTVGTCGVTDAAVTGDSYLRLRGPSGTEVASNDDACGGAGSKVTFTATVAGTYEIRAGCYQNTQCSGTVSWEVTAGSTTPPTSGSTPFNVSNTNNATQGTVNADVALVAGQALSFGSCGVTGASGTGDTVVRLFNAAGQQVTFNDDACGSLSHAAYTVPTGAGGTYQIRIGCFGSSACSGTLAWTTQ
ncbi:trypsin-like serine protease [Corallococcus llansteffanensis]|uniref:Serine protease n=1 Tax=Corallococcus llansteffanensis TaxID=2316731 RepID=A0A3A8N9J6_9BACT|nr:trypsin-like serine protease [Corallococcus llansteffanensis]RKH37805.1 serine protease [Corallococcus llansteffanensis]